MEQQQYVLGHSAQELRRLEQQGRYLRDLTRDLLVRAGVGPGMRVLDFGAGAGDVTLIASELVGPTGEVVSLDRSADALARLRARIEAGRIANVHPIHADESAVADLSRTRSFDAVVGRLVLLHQRDPAATVVGLARAVRPGGVLAFHEIDIEARYWCEPELPLLARAFGWITQTFTRGGMPADIGRRLTRAFAEAGLVDRRIVREGPMESGADTGAYEFMAQTVRSLLPAAVRMGLATEEEVAIDTLAERMRAEAVAVGAHFIPCFFVGASGRVPG
jgi:ubiquinone/menaquinone biosynthesis C-methylase UbiE